MMTGEEIVECLGKAIIIYPFDEKRLRGACYNLRVGRFVWLHPYKDDKGALVSSQTPLDGELKPSGRVFRIPPGAVACVLTEETVFVDEGIAGMFHSKVDMVTKGFSHISTTLDPGWIGPLLVTMHNCRAEPIDLWQGETFVKMSLHKLAKVTCQKHNNPAGRADLISKLGFRLPPGEEDYFDDSVRCNFEALRREFLATPIAKNILEHRQNRSNRAVRWLVFGLAVLAVTSGVTSPWWFPISFGGGVMDPKAIATMLAATLTGFLVFVTQIILKDPPWKR